MKSQSVLINCNKCALSSLPTKAQKLSKTSLVWTPIKGLSFYNRGVGPRGTRLKALNFGGPLSKKKPKIWTKDYNYFATRFLVKSLFLKPYGNFFGNKSTQTFGLGPSGSQIDHLASLELCQQSKHQSFGQWSFLVKKAPYPKYVLASLKNYEEVQIIKSVLIPPIVTNTFIFGLYKLQKQTYKYKEPIRNICKYLVVYVVGSVCWLYYANISTKIEKTENKQGWNLAQEVVQKNLPLFQNSGLFLTKQATQIPTLWPRWVMACGEQGHSLEPCEVVPLACYEEQAQQKGSESQKLNLFTNIPLDSKDFVHKTLAQGLQNNYTFFRETSNPLSCLVNSSSLNTILGQGSNLNHFVQRPQPGPKPFQHFFQDKITQNYIANIPTKGDYQLHIKGNFNVQNKVVPLVDFGDLRGQATKHTKNLFFFARKPLFFKKERSSFLSTQMLSQKQQYLCAGTAMIMGSEFDFLPRKIESTGFSNQNKSTTSIVENPRVKFSVEMTKMEKPRIYKFISDVTLQSIKNAELKQNFGFGLATSWWSACAWEAQPGLETKSIPTQECLEPSLPYFLKELETCAFKIKTGEQKGYFKSLKSSFLSVKSRSHRTTTETLSKNPRDSWHESFGASSLKSNQPSDDRGTNQPIRSQNKRGIEQKNFSRTLNMVGPGPKDKVKGLSAALLGGAKGAKKSKQLGGTKKAPNQTTDIKNKNFLEKFCRSRLQSGFNFPDILLLNKPLIEVEKNGTALKIKKNFGVNPKKSSIPTVYGLFSKTDCTPFSDNLEFYGSNKKTKREVNRFTVDSSKSALLCFLVAPLDSLEPNPVNTSNTVNWPKNSLRPPSLGKSLKNLTNIPESFFGTSYLHLGERFTIEKIKSKNQIGFLNNVHNGDMFAPSLKSTLPFVSTGTSLNTVFGKKALKQQSSKKAFKTQSPLTNARAVSQWHITDFPKYKGFSHRDHVQQDSETRGPNQNTYLKNNLVKNQKTVNRGFVEIEQQNTSNLGYLLYPKRISGKVNRHLINPFKYYNPGTKRDRNIEDAMLTLEGYKKSRLFPTTHINYQGISSQLLNVSIAKKHQGHYLNTHTNQDIDLQSILSGMRQKNEAQRIAEKTIGPLYGNLGLQKESDLRHKEELGEDENSTRTWENIEDNRGADSFFEEKGANLKHHENSIQKKNLRNTNNYPPGTLLASASWRFWRHQTHCPKNLKATALAEYNFINIGISPYSLHPNSSTVKILEEKLLDNSQLATRLLDSSRPSVRLWPGKKIKKAQGQSGHDSFLQGSNQTKGFYFEKIFATPLLRSQPQTFRFTGGMENALRSSKNVFMRGQVWGSLSKILFFSIIWSSYKILATPLTISNFLPATFTEAIGLQSFQKKYRIITRGNTKVDFTNLAGIEKTLSELRDLIWTFRLVGTGGPYSEYSYLTHLPYLGNSFGQQRSSVFSKTRNRFLLVGPPGTGKTLLVKALAAEANVPVIVQPVSQLRMISGVENPVSTLFHVARQIKPCIIFLDELDTLGTDINHSDKSANTEQKLDTKLAQKYTYTLLLELDGLISSTRDLLIIGATNRPETLNPALTRAGRFETVINCNLPSQEQRLALFSLYLPRGFGTDGPLGGAGLIQHATVAPHSKQKGPLVGAFSTSTTSSEVSETQGHGTSSWFSSLGGRGRYQPLLDGFGLAKHRPSKSAKQHSAPSGVYLKEPRSLVQPTDRFGAGSTRVPGQKQKSNSSLVFELPQGPQLRSKHHKVIRNVSYLHYVTKIAYGLSQASIETAINQSALNSILRGNRCHTFTTLEQAFNAVKVLNSKTTAEKAFDSSWSSSRFVSAGSKESHGINKEAVLSSIASKATRNPASKSLVNMFTSKQKNLQFLVCTAYQTTGPLLLSKKTTSYSKKLFKVYLTGLFRRKQLTVYKNQEDFALQSLEFALFKNYAGQACLNLYHGIRCQSLQFSHTFGLYKNPVELGTTLFLLKNESDGYFSTKSGILSTPWFQQNAEGLVDKNDLLSTNKKQKDHGWCQNIKKENKNTQQISSVQKTSSFFVNELSRQTRLNNPLKTGWFRMYLSRPIFRYDSSEYIENKEYYPKNNYSFYSEKRLQPLALRMLLGARNATKQHCTGTGLVFSGSQEQRFTHFKNVATLNHQTTFNVPLSWTAGPTKPVSQVAEPFGKIYRENNFAPQKFSLYLAIVAFIFHNTLLFMQENRELVDYCVYKKLRYGGLYEFYIDQVCQKFS